MNVSEVIASVKEWVQQSPAQMQGFTGAYLAGGINTMAPEESFPSYRDVDVCVVLKGETPSHNDAPLHNGLFIDCSYRSLELLQKTESVLSSLDLAPNLVAARILADPTGVLVQIQDRVRGAYPRRNWVLARCETAKELALQVIPQMENAETMAGAGMSLAFGIMHLGGVVAAASLEPPTHRKSLVQMRRLLSPRGRSDLCEEILGVLGVSNFARSSVGTYLEESARAFVRATEVYRTPHIFGAKIRPHVAPYLVQGAREFIDDGYWREAMPWILMSHSGSVEVLEADAPAGERSGFRRPYERLLADMGLETLGDCSIRAASIQGFSQRLFSYCDELASDNTTPSN